MSFTKKDIFSTISVVAIVVFTASLMAGFIESVDGRWALGSLAILLAAGITGLVTGTVKMMQHTWSVVALYLLTTSMLVITVINAFLNSEAWLIALTINVVLMWLEYIMIEFFSKAHSRQNPTNLSTGTVA